MLEKYYDGQHFHKRITGDKIIDKTNNIIWDYTEELSQLAKSAKDELEHFSTVLYKTNNCTLTIHKSKPAKKVTILSSKHKRIKINNDRKRIPATVTYYNKTQIRRSNGRRRKESTACPVQVSFNILDLTGINAWILYKETSRQNISRQQFLLQIAEELIEEYHEFLQEEKEDLQGTLSGQGNISHSQKTCQIRLCKENKTTKACIICEKYVYVTL
ncbi:piggyBac transposable element-derived protein 4-like [Vespula maculifrons]|uniref:PiggyBac transposable element-derived protein 4-like n=1 Tax=Vespula maculifrons TaxID=7453 RepID=A0ABD2BZR8_VESMC